MFVDEAEFNVVPLDICGIVFGNPYLYDQKAISIENIINITCSKKKLSI